MVKPSVKKEVVDYLKSTYKAGTGRMTGLVGRSRSNWYYESKKDDGEIVKKFKELVGKYPNRGFDNYYHRIRREGNKWARSRMLRVYREMGLVRRPKKRKRLPEELRKPLKQPKGLNEVWSMDFMSDSLSDGRTFRVINIIDDCNRECLKNKGSISYPSQSVIRELEQIGEEIGLPKYIRTDNGPEFTSKDYRQWCEKHKITRVYSEPGKPMQNGFVERFNRTFREDILDAYLFSSISQFNVLAEKWKDDYNSTHPHQSLGNKGPQEYAQRSHPSVGLAPQRGVQNTII